MFIGSSFADPHCFQCGSRSSILGQCGCGSEPGSRIWWPKIVKIYSWKHPAIEQNIKFLYFSLFLWVALPSWIRIQPTKINADPFGSATLIGSTGNVYLWIRMDTRAVLSKQRIRNRSGLGDQESTDRVAWHRSEDPTLWWLGMTHPEDVMSLGLSAVVSHHTGGAFHHLHTNNIMSNMEQQGHQHPKIW